MAEYSKLVEKLEAKDKEIKGLKDAHERERRDLLNQNEEMKQNINALTTEKLNLEKDLQSKSRLEDELDDLKNSLETSKEEIKELNGEKQILTAENLKFDAEVALLQEEVKQIKRN